MDRLEAFSGFKYRVTSAYHPQSNGLDERFKQTLKSSLQHLVNSNQNNWDDLLDEVLFSYRTSRQDSTKFTPFFLMHGREARLLIDIKMSAEGNCTSSPLSTEEKVERLISLREKAHLTALSNIAKAQENQQRQFNSKHNVGSSIKVSSIFYSVKILGFKLYYYLFEIQYFANILQVGDKVLAKNMKNEGRKGGKLDVQFRGPFTVVEDIGKGRYKLKDEKGKVLKTSYNVARLKLWLEPNTKMEVR